MSCFLECSPTMSCLIAAASSSQLQRPAADVRAVGAIKQVARCIQTLSIRAGSLSGNCEHESTNGCHAQSMAVHSAILKGRKEMDDITHDETVRKAT